MIGRRVLHVDDDAATRKLVAYLLKRHGCRVAFDVDGLGVWRALETFQPALILMDVSLPALCGIELAREIKTNLSTPIVFLTARAMPDERARCMAAGCDGYITKPFSTRFLPQLIADTLGRLGSCSMQPGR